MEKDIKIPLKGQNEGEISLKNINNPYGEGSEAILSIGVYLKKSQDAWKIHIPYENIKELIKALESFDKS